MRSRPRFPTTPATVFGGLALLIGPGAMAQQVDPAPTRTPVTPTTPIPTGGVQTTAPTPTPVQEPAAPVTEQEQKEEDRVLAESMKGQTEIDVSSVNLAIPSGWVRIAVDLDNDGTFDAIETIHVDDLRQARMISLERQGLMSGAAGQAGEPMQEGRGVGEGEGEGDDESFPDEIELTGTIQEVREFNLSGFSSPHRIARLETEEGVAKVDFGPSDLSDELSLDEGDEVTVVGQRGMINDRPVLMARSVTKGDTSVDVENPEDGMIKRIRGEIVGTRTVNFRSRDDDHVIAEIEMRSGNRAEVILGPKSKLGDLELAEGDEVALLVRPARLNGQPAMAAEQVRVGDTAIAVSDPVTEPAEVESESDDSDTGSESDDSLIPSLSNPAPGNDS